MINKESYRPASYCFFGFALMTQCINLMLIALQGTATQTVVTSHNVLLFFIAMLLASFGGLLRLLHNDYQKSLVAVPVPVQTVT